MSEILATEKYTFNTEGQSVSEIAETILLFMKDKPFKETGQWSFTHEARTLTIIRKYKSTL